MIPSKTPEDNSSDPSSLGNAADYSGPGQRSNSSAETASGISAHVPIAPAREPLLSETEIDAIIERSYTGPMEYVGAIVASRVRDFYEGLIASGELRAVKKATIKLTDNGEHGHCSICGKLVWNTWMLKADNFCPKCGSEILPL